MNWNHSQLLNFFSKRGREKLLLDVRHGLEKECLRVRGERLATTRHPQQLGSALTHPFIHTDFAEAQLELVTPPMRSAEASIDFLYDLHRFIARKLPNERLWPTSMPCRLPSEEKIAIAEYGPSYEGQRRHLYRVGLSHRYGRTMQTISGTHYNFSLGSSFWNVMYAQHGKKFSRKDFISESYLHLIRNFLRFGWLATYLFGASPVAEKKFSTSLRMSHLGYYSKGQSQRVISTNSLTDYTHDLREAISTPHEPFTAIGVVKDGKQLQLNDHFLQFEAEYYARARPKPKRSHGEGVLEALRRRGIAYVEIRSLDLDPYRPTGVEIDELLFLHTFLLFCLFSPSLPILPREFPEITGNQDHVALFGRQPKLQLHHRGRSIALKQWGLAMLHDMRPLAHLLDQADGGSQYTCNLNLQEQKVKDPEQTPSARLLRDLQKRRESMSSFGARLARVNHTLSQSKPLPSKRGLFFHNTAVASRQQEVEANKRPDCRLPGFEDMELSTQILLREAIRRKIDIEILDRNENFLRLRKGNRTEYIKQATEASIDSAIVYQAMGNKHVTKRLLEDAGIRVPRGEVYTSIEQALSSRATRPEVVKPKTTNYGIGIAFISTGDRAAYEAAVHEAFRHDDSILVEEFCPGREFRFLIVGKRVISIVERLPAHVTGDGRHTIQELVRIKNETLPYYKPWKYRIVLEKTERSFLKTKRLTPKSVPGKGKRIFLRRNTNVSTGGEAFEVSDHIHSGYKRAALRAAKAVGSKLCGVDMIIRNIRRAPTTMNHAVIELNYNPALLIHCMAMKNREQIVAGSVLDLLKLSS